MFNAVATFQFSTLLNLQVSLGLEEQGTADKRATRNNDNAPTLLGTTVDDSL